MLGRRRLMSSTVVVERKWLSIGLSGSVTSPASTVTLSHVSAGVIYCAFFTLPQYGMRMWP